MVRVGHLQYHRYLMVLGTALLVECVLFATMSRSVLAQIPLNGGPFIFTMRRLEISNFRINRAALASGASLADSIEVDAIITNLVISKTVAIPCVGEVTFVMATTGHTPAQFLGLRSHIVSFSSDQGPFRSLDVTPGEILLNAEGGLDPDTLEILRNLKVVLTNVRIETTFSIVSFAIIPDILLTVQVKPSCFN